MTNHDETGVATRHLSDAEGGQIGMLAGTRRVFDTLVLVVGGRTGDDQADLGDLRIFFRRSGGVSFAVSGLLVAVVGPWHPNVLERPVDQVVHTFGGWAPLHMMLVAAVILTLPGAAGLFAGHKGHSGRLAQAGLIVAVVGGVAAASLLAAEAIVFPVLADHAPDLLALDGPLLASPLFIGMGVLASGWPLGLSLLGLAAARAGVFNRPAGILLAVSGPLFLGLAGPFVPVAGALATVIFGGAQIWWGLLLSREALIPPATSI